LGKEPLPKFIVFLNALLGFFLTSQELMPSYFEDFRPGKDSTCFQGKGKMLKETIQRVWGVAQVVQYLPSMCERPSSICSIKMRGKKKKQKLFKAPIQLDWGDKSYAAARRQIHLEPASQLRPQNRHLCTHLQWQRKNTETKS
jgi:hypothetical protein